MALCHVSADGFSMNNSVASVVTRVVGYHLLKYGGIHLLM